jgi:hypothetical protein
MTARPRAEGATPMRLPAATLAFTMLGALACASSEPSRPPGGAGGDGEGGAAGTSSGGGSGGRAGSGGNGAGGAVGGSGVTADAAIVGAADAGAEASPPDLAAPIDAGSDASATLPHFSFFVTSLEALRKLSGNNKGFGGDLRFGKADGLAGADEICRQVAELGMPGAGKKTWRAFLSVTAGPGNTPVNAIDRVGSGPWYDRIGRLVAMSKADLTQNRPRGAATAIINDLPNEQGIPNGHPVPGQGRVDNHHTLTGSKADGTLNSMNKSDTCNDWTSAVGSAGRPRVGVSWPRSPGDGWISWGFEGGCAPGYNLIEGAGATEGNMAVGSNGGYGGFYCLALEP